jgi:alpha-ketoglutarate-dependent taurine dioxygenase
MTTRTGGQPLDEESQRGPRPRTHELHDGYLRVHFARGHGDFHLRWLRHNDPEDRHPITGERTVCSSELPDDLRVTRVIIAGDVLEIAWAHDGRTSRYNIGWLEAHAYALDRAQVPPPPSDVRRFELRRDDRSLDGVTREALARLFEQGAAVVRRGTPSLPPEDETEGLIEALLARGLRLTDTHFGRIEDLRVDNNTNANTDQLGYTDAPVDPHTDQPFLDDPPRYQLLHSIRKAELGGESYLVDGLATARYLESLDADAFSKLVGTKVVFHRRQKAFEKLAAAPILTFTPQFRVRHSYFTLAPYQVPFAEMEAWYRAHDRFARLVRDPRHQVRFTLEPGDFVLYDNHRMLHARTGFRGGRWVRGVYFDA